VIISPIRVEYDDHMGSDLTCVNAARASFGKKSAFITPADERLIQFLARGYTTDQWDALAEELMGMEDPKDVQRLLFEVKNHAQHWAPFAHPHLSIRLKAPIFVVRQLAKHQVGGVWSEVSRRYVDEEPELWFENELHKRPVGNIKQGASTDVTHEPMIRLNNDHIGYDRFDIAQINVDWYMQAIKDGVAPEEAREHLPLNMHTEWLWTGSLLFFARVCNQRLDPHAQAATREVAAAIHPILAEHFPISTAALVRNP
jgi:thymidylate synthase (FAD)